MLLPLVYSVVLLPTGDSSSQSWSTKLRNADNVCFDDDYFKDTLKEQLSAPIGGLIQRAPHAESYEASDVVYDTTRDSYFVVFDNTEAIGKLSAQMVRGPDNVLVEMSSDSSVATAYFEDGHEGYEGIAHDASTDLFYLLVESVKFDVGDDNKMYHPVIRSAVYNESDTRCTHGCYEEQSFCAVALEEPTSNKGLESLSLIEIEGSKYFAAICEGNYCSYSDEADDSGHGRLVLIEMNAISLDSSIHSNYSYLLDANVSCLHQVVDVYELPDYIDFIDYSALRIRQQEQTADMYDIVIGSQESSAVWIGEVQWSLDSGPNFDVNDKDGKVLYLPKNDLCETIFCNIEGLEFLDVDQLVLVSDKAKRGGDQPSVCGIKDQSIHIMKLP